LEVFSTLVILSRILDPDPPVISVSPIQQEARKRKKKEKEKKRKVKEKEKKKRKKIIRRNHFSTTWACSSYSCVCLTLSHSASLCLTLPHSAPPAAALFLLLSVESHSSCFSFCHFLVVVISLHLLLLLLFLLLSLFFQFFLKDGLLPTQDCPSRENRFFFLFFFFSQKVNFDLTFLPSVRPHRECHSGDCHQGRPRRVSKHL